MSEKEHKKKKKIKGAEDAEADMKNGSREGELTLVFGENGGGLEMDIAERKRNKREKKKNKKFEMHDTEEAKWGGRNSGSVSGKEVIEAKKRKMKTSDIKEGEKDGENCLVNATEMRKKRKKDERKSNDDNTVGSKKSPEKVEDHTQLANAKTNHQGKKKKTKILRNGSDDRRDIEAESANKGKKRNKSSKKVRFSDQDEVFPLPCNSPHLVRGKRFSHEEDAVLKYIEEHALGDEGLHMVLSCSKHPELRGCWKEIASAIPYRPYIAVYCRARVLFMRSESRKWSQEEYDMIKKYQEEHGNQWRALADELGKHTWHVKDTWRRIKLPNLKKGHWSQEY